MKLTTNVVKAICAFYLSSYLFLLGIVSSFGAFNDADKRIWFSPDDSLYSSLSELSGEIITLKTQHMITGVSVMCWVCLLVLLPWFIMYWRRKCDDTPLFNRIALFSLIFVTANSNILFWAGEVNLNAGLEAFKLFLLMVSVGYVFYASRPSHQQKSNILIAYASQTGTAKGYATSLYDSMQEKMDICCLSSLTAEMMTRYSNVLFLVSTCGDGDAPDSAKPFLKSLTTYSPGSLMPEFSVLGFGDKSYAKFCQFGHQLHEHLEQMGMAAMMPFTAIDRANHNAIEQWWTAIKKQLQVESELVNFEHQTQQWQVLDNRCLNPDDEGRHVHRLRFSHFDLSYEAGDIVSILPEVDRDESEDSLPAIQPRLYSIASYKEGEVELLVRHHIRPDGSSGIGSGYLSRLMSGDQIQGRVVSHPHFHYQSDVPVVLIGAGTGIAPLMSLLEKKQQRNWQSPAWLFFGERSQASDHYYRSEIESYQCDDVLTNTTYAWSKDDNVYLQQRLEENMNELKEWLEQQGAHIYLCGRLNGFGQAVLELLASNFSEGVMQNQLHKDLY